MTDKVIAIEYERGKVADAYFDGLVENQVERGRLTCSDMIYTLTEWAGEASLKMKCSVSRGCRQVKCHPLKSFPMTDPCMLYMVTWIPSIYPSHVSIYIYIAYYMDPMGYIDYSYGLYGSYGL